MTIDTNCPGPEAAARAHIAHIRFWSNCYKEMGGHGVVCGLLDELANMHAAELRAQPQGEPVGELVALDDGLGTVVCQWDEERRARLPVGTKFYTRPDPRVAELEVLLLETRRYVAVVDDINAGRLVRLIDAALGEGK